MKTKKILLLAATAVLSIIASSCAPMPPPHYGPARAGRVIPPPQNYARNTGASPFLAAASGLGLIDPRLANMQASVVRSPGANSWNQGNGNDYRSDSNYNRNNYSNSGNYSNYNNSNDYSSRQQETRAERIQREAYERGYNAARKNNGNSANSSYYNQPRRSQDYDSNYYDPRQDNNQGSFFGF